MLTTPSGRYNARITIHLKPGTSKKLAYDLRGRLNAVIEAKSVPLPPSVDSAAIVKATVDIEWWRKERNKKMVCASDVIQSIYQLYATELE